MREAAGVPFLFLGIAVMFATGVYILWKAWAFISGLNIILFILSLFLFPITMTVVPIYLAVTQGDFSVLIYGLGGFVAAMACIGVSALIRGDR